MRFWQIILAAAAAGVAATGSNGPPAERTELAPGLVVERVPADLTPAVDSSDRRITLVRLDPERYRLRLLTAAEHGARTAPEWVEEFGLTGVINASMFLPDERSSGYMVDGATVHNGRDNPLFGAFLAFNPRRAGLPPVSLLGRQCGEFDLARVRADYDTVVQNYRMLDCDGSGICWEDPKAYSVAAIGVDSDGWLVLIHCRTPYRMCDFNRMLAEPSLRLEAVMFTEGGPEASLYVATPAGTVKAVGSFETGFFDGSNYRFWNLPNVIGFEPRQAPAPGGG